MGSLVYGLVSAGLWAYRAVLTPRVRFASAALAPDELLFSGKALVVRDEVVLVAPRSGHLRRVVDSAGEVDAGQRVLELVDKQTINALDSQLAEENKKLEERASQSEDYVANKEAQLAAALSEFRQLSGEYAALLSAGQPVRAAAVYRDLDRAARNVDKLHNEYEHASRSISQYEDRKQELEEQRQAAIWPVSSPLNGRVSYRFDALGSQIRTHQIDTISLSTLRSTSDESSLLADGQTVSAGQPLCAIVDTTSVRLLIEVAGSERKDLQEGFEVRADGETLEAHFFKRRDTDEDDVSIYIYVIENPSEVVLSYRVVSVEFASLLEQAVTIPKKAVHSVDGVSLVYGLNEAGLVQEYIVRVREVKGTRAVVFGLRPDQEIITTPRLVTPGAPLGSSGGG
jgi:biotin carboxyl carrier protein